MKKAKLQSVLWMLLLVLTAQFAMGQSKTREQDSVNRKRLNTVIITGSAFYVTSLTVLYYGWYKDNPMTAWHFIDDSHYWLQVDKAGHATTSYTITNYGYWLLRWSGVSHRKSSWYSGLMGFGAMTVIEIMDGFSADYGASATDLLANALGSGLSVTQSLLWKEQRFKLKFSYHPTDYAQYNPSQLGKTPLQRTLKDYNGHTYWLSMNISSFIKKESRFPAWINVAAGYGAKGMLHPVTNPTEDENGNPIPQFKRVRQYYLSMDIDWTKIKTNSGFLRFVFKGLSFVKLPFPTLEYNSEDGFVGHWIYF
ncbi:MAG: YfiM family protein [Bacteroidales bacterium]|nr:YfiM family protein [Bacteroidales bacterium]